MDKLVDFEQGDVIKISSDRLQEMEFIAKSNMQKKRYRVCLHDNPQNRQHEMIICMTKDDYSRPHKHINMSETHIIIKGKERVVFFDENGRITENFVMDAGKGILCYRINSEVYHMSIPITEIVIEIETKGGPFYPESNVWAPWSPEPDNYLEVRRYIQGIVSKLENQQNV